MNDDEKRMIEHFEKLRATFPNCGFVIGVCDLDSNTIWGWSNMQAPQLVGKWLSQQESFTVRRSDRN